LFLQDRGYKIFRALLGKQALGLLALFGGEVVRVLAGIPVSILTTSQ
jgi:hypothetical protein